MKKAISLLLVILLGVSLVACGSGNTTAGDSANSVSSEADGETMEVDKGLLNVEITLPASFFTDTTEEEIQAEAAEQGISKCVVHEDGSVTYTMSKSKYNEMMAEMKASLDESIAEMVNGEDAVASFSRIEYNDDISEVDIYIDSTKYTALDSLYAVSFYLMGAYYQIFSGAPAEEVDVVVKLIDKDTGEVVDTASYQEMLSSAETSSGADTGAAN